MNEKKNVTACNESEGDPRPPRHSSNCISEEEATVTGRVKVRENAQQTDSDLQKNYKKITCSLNCCFKKNKTKEPCCCTCALPVTEMWHRS